MASFEKCRICKSIPDTAYRMEKVGYEDDDQDWPKNEAKLKIVGAPYVRTSSSEGNNCLKKCPECGTYYRWDFSYEFLANGTEDEYSLTRLSKKEGSAWEKRTIRQIKNEEKNKFRKHAAKHIKVLNQSKGRKQLEKAADFFETGARKGFDTSFVALRILKAIVNNPTLQDEEEYLLWLEYVLECATKADKEKLKKVAQVTLKAKKFKGHENEETLTRILKQFK